MNDDLVENDEPFEEREPSYGISEKVILLSYHNAKILSPQVIVSCYYDFGSVVKSFLSLPLWRPLSRLTYSAFLFHYLIIQFYFATMRELMYYSFMQGCMIFLGSILMVYPCAFMLSILIEQPLIRLEQLLLFRRI